MKLLKYEYIEIMAIFIIVIVNRLKIQCSVNFI